MRLPRAAAAVLAIRQLGDLLPDSYCVPQCPQCKAELKGFNSTTDCVTNSSFITNCGACQTCIAMNAIEYPGTPNAQILEADMIVVLNFCADSPASAAVQAYQSQAAKISQVGDQLAALATQTTSSPTGSITSPPAITGAFNTADPAWTTSPGAAAYLSELSAASTVNTPTPSITSPPQLNTSSPIPDSSASPSSLNRSWILGPVIGSVLGLATVAIVIFLTKRKQRLEEQARVAREEEEAPKDVLDDDASNSEQGKAQLHSECMEAKELDSKETEIQAPVELPVPDPVCPELNTPREGTMDFDNWPLQNKMPISPLPLMFAMADLRDMREERSRSSSPKQHDTFYHA